MSRFSSIDPNPASPWLLAVVLASGCFSAAGGPEFSDDADTGDTGSDTEPARGSDESGDGEGDTGPEPDRVPPRIERFEVNGSTDPGALNTPQYVSLRAEVTDDSTVARVDFYDGQQRLATSVAAPHEGQFLVSSLHNGIHELRVEATDGAGNLAISDIVSLDVALPDGGTEVWSHRASLHRVHDITTDHAGNLVVAGYADPVGGDDDIWIAKYGPDGTQLQWERIHDGPSGDGDRAFAVAIGPDDEVVAVGFDRKAALDHDGFVARYTAAGTLSWMIRHEGTAGTTDSATAVAVAETGDIVVAGSEQDAVAGPRIWVHVLDVDGDPHWSTTVAPLGGTLDAVGAVALGEGFGVVARQRPAGTETRVWARRFDDSGNVTWTRTIDSNMAGLDLEPHAAAATIDGGVAIVGEIDTLTSGTDVWLGSLDADGTLVWQTRIDGGAGLDDGGRDLEIGPDGIMAVAGVTVAATGEDVFAARVAPDGLPLWSYSHDGQGPRDAGLAVAVDPVGYVWVGADLFTDDTAADRWLAKLSP